ncbi:MAG: hypothetical protein RL508_1165 [Actinomycetota bacterium]|jgi:heavy metal translocating P-type ATPase
MAQVYARHLTAAIKCKNQTMRDFFERYWFVTATVLGLVVGLGFQAGSISIGADICWGLSGLVGLILSIRWLIDAIREGALGSDVLAVISLLATAIVGEWLATAVIALMLASGRALETWAEGRAHAQLGALLKRAPQTASVLDASGNPQTTPLDAVTIGTHILVRSGEVVPLDGKLVTAGTFDESALTGEPLPVFRAANTEVASGVVNTNGGVELITTADSKNSTYASLVRLVAQAQAESSHAVRLANKWAVRFVPFALLLAAGTWIITGDYHPAVAVIVAATPCPLILAVPVAIIAGMSKAAGKGAIIKGGAALEQLARAKVILLDKTGTLTHGGPQVTAAVFAPGTYEPQILGLAGSLEQQSPHVVAQAIVGYATLAKAQFSKANDVTEQHGVGLSGMVDGHRVRVGQPAADLPEWANLTESLLVAIEVDGQLVGLLGLDDPVREESRQTIAALRAIGVERMLLVSGDRKTTVEAVAATVGADGFYAECTPEQKLELLRAERSKTKGTVVAVGDGINDAPALAAADVGVAMGARGATAASEAADVVIVEDSIGHLAVAVDIAQGARGRALQASGFGMTLAVVAMLLGAVGVLGATQSAITQEFIDAGAILWALVPPRSRIKA